MGMKWRSLRVSFPSGDVFLGNEVVDRSHSPWSNGYCRKYALHKSSDCSVEPRKMCPSCVNHHYQSIGESRENKYLCSVLHVECTSRDGSKLRNTIRRGASIWFGEVLSLGPVLIPFE